jgi:hypothetical protein
MVFVSEDRRALHCPWNELGQATTPAAIKADSLWNYQIGTKNSFADRCWWSAADDSAQFSISIIERRLEYRRRPCLDGPIEAVVDHLSVL